MNTPKTPRSLTHTSCIVSMIENRAREVGLACMYLPSLQIVLTQFVDSATYMYTISTLYTWDPVELVASKSSEKSVLNMRIAEQLSAIPISYVSRTTFDEIKGAAIFSLCVDSIHDIEIESKYVCMAALAALVQYVETTQSMKIYTENLKIVFSYSEAILRIDYFTARSLELVASINNRNDMNLSSFFRCKTPEGLRLLRASLLQPSRDIESIKERQKAVLELNTKIEFKLELTGCLDQFPNTELIAGRLLQKPSYSNTYMKNQILTIVLARNLLFHTKTLYNIMMKNALQCKLLKNMMESLDDRRIDSTLDELLSIIDSNITLKNKVSSIDCVLAIREGYDTMIDVSRTIYLKTKEEIQTLFNEYKFKFNDSSLRLMYTESRGYYLQSSLPLESHSHLMSEGFVQISTKGKKTFMSTASLITLSNSLKQCKQEIISRSLQRIEDTIERVRSRIMCFYNISHVTSNLDLVLSFSKFAEEYYCCTPELSSNDLYVAKGRNLFLADDFVPLDFEMSSFLNVQLVTGKNSSGKTTYLKTLGILAILAYSGSLIPAKAAKFPKFDQIFSALGDIESLEHNNSSFLSSMQQFSYILENSTGNSLVIVDEIGRGTSHEDGVSLAWSIIETLIDVGPFCFISTHFSQLAELEGLYSSVKNTHMSCFSNLKGPNPQEEGYGLKLAEMSELPELIVSFAWNLSKKIKKVLSLILRNGGIRTNQEKHSIEIIDQLFKIKHESPQEDLKRNLLDFKRQLY